MIREGSEKPTATELQSEEFSEYFMMEYVIQCRSQQSAGQTESFSVVELFQNMLKQDKLHQAFPDLYETFSTKSNLSEHNHQKQNRKLHILELFLQNILIPRSKSLFELDSIEIQLQTLLHFCFDLFLEFSVENSLKRWEVPKDTNQKNSQSQKQLFEQLLFKTCERNIQSDTVNRQWQVQQETLTQFLENRHNFDRILDKIQNYFQCIQSQQQAQNQNGQGSIASMKVLCNIIITSIQTHIFRVAQASRTKIIDIHRQLINFEVQHYTHKMSTEYRRFLTDGIALFSCEQMRKVDLKRQKQICQMFVQSCCSQRNELALSPFLKKKAFIGDLCSEIILKHVEDQTQQKMSQESASFAEFVKSWIIDSLINQILNLLQQEFRESWLFHSASQGFSLKLKSLTDIWLLLYSFLCQTEQSSTLAPIQKQIFVSLLDQLQRIKRYNKFPSNQLITYLSISIFLRIEGMCAKKYSESPLCQTQWIGQTILQHQDLFFGVMHYLNQRQVISLQSSVKIRGQQDVIRQYQKGQQILTYLHEGIRLQSDGYQSLSSIEDKIAHLSQKQEDMHNLFVRFVTNGSIFVTKDRSQEEFKSPSFKWVSNVLKILNIHFVGEHTIKGQSKRARTQGIGSGFYDFKTLSLNNQSARVEEQSLNAEDDAFEFSDFLVQPYATSKKVFRTLLRESGLRNIDGMIPMKPRKKENKKVAFFDPLLCLFCDEHVLNNQGVTEILGLAIWISTELWLSHMSIQVLSQILSSKSQSKDSNSRQFYSLSSYGSYFSGARQSETRTEVLQKYKNGYYKSFMESILVFLLSLSHPTTTLKYFPIERDLLKYLLSLQLFPSLLLDNRFIFQEIKQLPSYPSDGRNESEVFDIFDGETIEQQIALVQSPEEMESLERKIFAKLQTRLRKTESQTRHRALNLDQDPSLKFSILPWLSIITNNKQIFSQLLSKSRGSEIVLRVLSEHKNSFQKRFEENIPYTIMAEMEKDSLRRSGNNRGSKYLRKGNRNVTMKKGISYNIPVKNVQRARDGGCPIRDFETKREILNFYKEFGHNERLTAVLERFV